MKTADLADHVARLARAAGPRARVGIDAVVRSDGSTLSALVADALIPDPVAVLHADDFLLPRSQRLEYGRDDPESQYSTWYDVAALRREALDHLGPDGDGSWLPALRDASTDRSVRTARVPAPASVVTVLDGRFLMRPDLRAGLDLVVHLVVSPAARSRRVPPDEQARLLPAWERYLAECDPAAGADVVVRYDHPDRPALAPPHPPR